MLTAVIAFSVSGSTSSAPGEAPTSSGDSGAQRWSTRVAGAVQRCPDARIGLRFYTRRFNEHRAKMGAGETGSHHAQSDAPCPRVRYLASRWRAKAYAARVAYERWAAVHVLHDPEVRPGNDAWQKAVQRVQRVFPGTASWLWSCSAAEGGHGRWVGFGGQGYSTWLRDSDTVGGPLQFRWSTFKGMYRRALDHVRASGYRVPPHLRDPKDDRSWRSMLGQALAGGWARWSGNDDSHWSASWSTGCR